MISWSYYPKLDLHREYTSTAYTVVHTFLADQYKLKNEYVILIHGKGSGELKNCVHRLLKEDKRVKEFQLDSDNLGQTIVHLNIKNK